MTTYRFNPELCPNPEKRSLVFQAAQLTADNRAEVLALVSEEDLSAPTTPEFADKEFIPFEGALPGPEHPAIVLDTGEMLFRVGVWAVRGTAPDGTLLSWFPITDDYFASHFEPITPES